MDRFEGLAVGFDLDGTITDDNGPGNVWDIEMLRHFGIERQCNSYDFCEAYGLTLDDVTRFCAENLQSIFRDVPLKPDCARVISSLRGAGVSVHIITARQAIYAPVSEDYLARHGVRYDSILFTHDKVRACLDRSVSFFADDKTENCLDLRRAGIECVMVDALHNSLVDYAPRVQSWNEIEALVWSSLRRTKGTAPSAPPATERLA